MQHLNVNASNLNQSSLRAGLCQPDLHGPKNGLGRPSPDLPSRASQNFLLLPTPIAAGSARNTSATGPAEGYDRFRERRGEKREVGAQHLAAVVGQRSSPALPTPAVSARIVFFPGLGCDHRMVEPNRGIALPFDVPKWLPTRWGESLADYSKRMAGTIDASTPIYLAGVSLGAMVAMEVARYVPCRGLILIAGCRSWRGVPFLYRQVGRLAARAPKRLAWPVKRVMPRARILFGMKRGSDVELFQRMLDDADVDFVQWSLAAIQDWQGVGRLRVPSLSIHGTIDHVLPRERAGPIDYQVVGAGHVVNVTHAAEVNGVVNRWLADRGEVVSR